jgi:predicted nuclease of predicted toxin-antitoxin system
VRFLVDENLSPLLASLLVDAGHDADHVARVGLGASDDATLLEFADSTKAVIISADTDFSALLSRTSRMSPSVVLFRRLADRRPEQQARLILDNLDQFAISLEHGAVVVFMDERIRVRHLPLIPRDGDPRT